MKSVKILYPGQNGTKKWVAAYGDALLYVRYRHDKKAGRRYTTVEVIVDEALIKRKNSQPPANKLVMIRVYQHERYLQNMMKSVGGCWKPQCGLWQIPYGEVVALGLENRIES